MGLSNWPTIVDDDGSLTLGTVLEKAVFDAIKASIEADVFSTTNPAVTAENIIDEVVTARGSKASLDARLDIALNEDGTLKTQASLVTQADASAVSNRNCLINDAFLIWALGDAVAPTSWALVGTGAACARSGTGLGDTTTKIGDFCAKLTYGTTTLTLYQNFLPTAAFTRLVALRGKTFGFGGWVKSAVASQARLYVTDGVTTTYSTYHTGDGTWQWLSGTHTISNTATLLTKGISVESSAGNPVYYSGAMAVQSNIAPSEYRPTEVLYSTLGFFNAGSIAVGTDKWRYQFVRPALIKDLTAHTKTANTGASLLIDVNHWDGAVDETMTTTKLTVTASGIIGSQAPDGTYQYRCFSGSRSSLTASMLRIDVDQIGSTIAGADVTIIVRFLEYVDPFEAFKEV